MTNITNYLRHKNIQSLTNPVSPENLTQKVQQFLSMAETSSNDNTTGRDTNQLPIEQAKEINSYKNQASQETTEKRAQIYLRQLRAILKNKTLPLYPVERAITELEQQYQRPFDQLIIDDNQNGTI